MSDVIACPACQREVRVPPEFAGRTVQCPECRHTFVAGAPPTGDFTPSAEPHRPVRHRDAREDDAFDDWGQRVRAPSLRTDRSGMILAFGILTIMAPCFLGLVFGPLAWFMGSSDLAAIDQGDLGGANRSLIQAGRIIGGVGFCFQLIVLAITAAYFVFLFALIGG